MKETPGSWAPTGEMFLYSEPWGFMSRLKSFEVRTCNYVVLPPPLLSLKAFRKQNEQAGLLHSSVSGERDWLLTLEREGLLTLRAGLPSCPGGAVVLWHCCSLVRGLSLF